MGLFPLAFSLLRSCRNEKEERGEGGKTRQEAGSQAVKAAEGHLTAWIH